jgi:hypothetical protein
MLSRTRIATHIRATGTSSGELVYQAAKHCIDRGTPVKYWEVWNEINTGWMVDPEGWDHLKTYTTLYDTCWKAVRRADPKAWIGGPCVASGPWNDKDPRGPGVNGEKFMRGLMEHCEKTGAPLDFITWHEYFQTHQTMKKEADQIKGVPQGLPQGRETGQGIRDHRVELRLVAR